MNEEKETEEEEEGNEESYSAPSPSRSFLANLLRLTRYVYHGGTGMSLGGSENHWEFCNESYM